MVKDIFIGLIVLFILSRFLPIIMLMFVAPAVIMFVLLRKR